MSVRSSVLVIVFLPLFAGFGAGPLGADPPGRVARLSYLSGEVSFRPESQDDWGPATLNYPLTRGDHVWTDAGSRCELGTGAAVIRLAPRTAVSFLSLDEDTTQVRLAEGALDLSVQALDDGGVVEVDTPNGAISIERPGSYRVDVSPDGERTLVSVRRGRAEIATSDADVSVVEGEAVSLEGLGSASYERSELPAPDDFDDWSALRDRRAEQAETLRYVSPDVVGWRDLDDSGRWSVTAQWGPVWFPSVREAGWAPYRFGHWAWVPPWGWTWIDDAPWGFAPFHYGRWAFVQGAWAWVPGQIAPRPYYAPALVAFVGGGSWSAALSIGATGVAWFPLGPREVYVPPYAVSRVYVERVNVAAVRVTDVDLARANVTYVNRSVPGAVTAVPRAVFAGGRPAAPAAVAVSASAVARAPVGSLRPIEPEPLRPAGRWSGPPAAVTERTVVSRMAPPAAPPPAALPSAAPPSATPQPQAAARPTLARPLRRGEGNTPAAPRPPRPAPSAAPNERPRVEEQGPPVHESAKTRPEPRVERAEPVRGEKLGPAASPTPRPKPEAGTEGKAAPKTGHGEKDKEKDKAKDRAKAHEKEHEKEH